jgi:hypothetical protein
MRSHTQFSRQGRFSHASKMDTPSQEGKIQNIRKL